jgi:hypothetical protein
MEHMLTTIDNPYNPFTHFKEWYAFDTHAGYHTTAYLARIVRSSPDLSEADQSLAIEQGIDEIIEENVLGIYIRITKDEKPRPQALAHAESMTDQEKSIMVSEMIRQEVISKHKLEMDEHITNLIGESGE